MCIRDRFPDPERFLRWLHEKGMHTTLNLHPAQGIQAHEKCYPEAAKALGVDAASEEPVKFDFTDSAFIKAYFLSLIHILWYLRQEYFRM